MTNGEGHNPYEAPAVEVALPPVRPESLPLASRWARFWGAMIDLVIAGVVTWSLLFVVGLGQRILAGDVSDFEMLLINLFALVLYPLLHGWLLAVRGQTIGKAIVRTQIVSGETGEILPVWKVVAVRFAPFALAALVPAVGGLVSLLDALAIFRQDRRCLHDHLAGTKVVDVRNVSL